uniref:General transcription and DNA repair factor IIH subunit TFB5 n=1 Tax=Takifugu rubripes TaxID=31033 RepID=A0A674PPK5_TAKRU
MVNVHKGVLLECDPAMKEFLLHLDETMVVQTLQERVGELMDQNSFPITQK